MSLTILIGIPGAGKSTVAATNFPNHVYVNQDTLGSREACLKAVNEALSAGKDVILDRCNQTPRHRAEFVKMAQTFRTKVNAVYVDCSLQTAIKRVILRQDHATLGGDVSNAKKSKIVTKFHNELVLPNLLEGFDSILFIRN